MHAIFRTTALSLDPGPGGRAQALSPGIVLRRRPPHAILERDHFVPSFRLLTALEKLHPGR